MNLSFALKISLLVSIMLWHAVPKWQLEGILSPPSLTEKQDETIPIRQKPPKPVNAHPAVADTPANSRGESKGREGQRPWTSEEDAKIPGVIQALVAAAGREDVVQAHAIQGDRTANTQEIIERVLGQRRTGVALYMRAKKVYRSWDKALEAAGFDPEEIRGKVADWTSEEDAKIPEVIQALVAVGGEDVVQARAIQGDRTDRTEQIIERVLGQRRPGQALYSRSRKVYGSWDAALEASGFDPEEIHGRAADWTFEEEAKIPEVIQALVAAGGEGIVRVRAIQMDRTDRTEQIIERVLGQRRTGQALYSRSRKVYGSWDKTLEAAGFDPEEIRGTAADWTSKEEAKIPEVIQALVAAGGEDVVRGGAIGRDSTAKTQEIVEAVLGHRRTGRALYNRAIIVYGSWDAALEAAMKQIGDKEEAQTPGGVEGYGEERLPVETESVVIKPVGSTLSPLDERKSEGEATPSQPAEKDQPTDQVEADLGSAEKAEKGVSLSKSPKSKDESTSQTPAQQLRLMIARLVQFYNSGKEKEAQKLWDEIAPLYVRYHRHISFFYIHLAANMYLANSLTSTTTPRIWVAAAGETSASAWEYLRKPLEARGMAVPVITSLDLSLDMSEEYRKLDILKEGSHIFVQGDMRHPVSASLGEGEFDVAVNGSLSLIKPSERLQMLIGAKATLKPNGRLVLLSGLGPFVEGLDDVLKALNFKLLNPRERKLALNSQYKTLFTEEGWAYFQEKISQGYIIVAENVGPIDEEKLDLISDEMLLYQREADAGKAGRQEVLAATLGADVEELEPSQAGDRAGDSSEAQNIQGSSRRRFNPDQDSLFSDFGSLLDVIQFQRVDARNARPATGREAKEGKVVEEDKVDMEKLLRIPLIGLPTVAEKAAVGQVREAFSRALNQLLELGVFPQKQGRKGKGWELVWQTSVEDLAENLQGWNEDKRRQILEQLRLVRDGYVEEVRSLGVLPDRAQQEDQWSLMWLDERIALVEKTQDVDALLSERFVLKSL